MLREPQEDEAQLIHIVAGSSNEYLCFRSFCEFLLMSFGALIVGEESPLFLSVLDWVFCLSFSRAYDKREKEKGRESTNFRCTSRFFGFRLVLWCCTSISFFSGW